MANIVIPFAAVTHQPVPSAGFNNNFTEVAAKFNQFAVQTDVAKVITVTHTWNASQTFALGMLLQGDLLFTEANTPDIGKAGATRPRDGFFSRNLVVGGALTVTGLITAANYSGTGPISLILPGAATNIAVTVNNNRSSNALDRIGYYMTFALGQLAAIEGMNENTGNNRGSLILRTGDGLGALQDVLTLDSNKKATFAAGAQWNGDVLFTDALYDIGKSGATRPRDGFFSRNLVAGSAITAGAAVAGTAFQVGGQQVVGARMPGWATQTGGGLTRADMGASPTLATVGTTLEALINDLRGHGLI